MRRREVLDVKEIEALAKYLSFMLSFDAQSLSGMHAPETPLKRGPNIIAPDVRGD
jgi:hypothetical protein